jgi:hypothetical protein
MTVTCALDNPTRQPGALALEVRSMKLAAQERGAIGRIFGGLLVEACQRDSGRVTWAVEGKRASMHDAEQAVINHMTTFRAFKDVALGERFVFAEQTDFSLGKTFVKVGPRSYEEAIHGMASVAAGRFIRRHQVGTISIATLPV